MSKEKLETEVVELDAEAVATIAETVSKGLSETLSKELDAKLEAKLAEKEEKALEKAEKVIKKPVTTGDDPAKTEKESLLEKKRMFVKGAAALVKGDKAALKEYNEKAIEARTKAGYSNTEINADGGYIVALPEFEAEIESLSEEYGVAFNEASVRPTTRNKILTNKRGNNVSMTEIGEGVKKPVFKLTIDQIEVTLRKFAGISVVTDELTDDAAIDFWADLRDGFAEERARVADELVFTDRTAGLEGVLHKPGIAVISVGSVITDLTWDDLLDAEVAVPTKSMRNGKHYMHRTVWNVVRKSKDDESRYQLFPAAGLQTPWGVPVVLVDALPSIHDVADANEPYTVFGDLKRVRLYVRQGLTFKVLEEGQITNVDGETINLGEQDMKALRAVTRMVALVKFPEAFAAIGTGTVS